MSFHPVFSYCSSKNGGSWTTYLGLIIAHKDNTWGSRGLWTVLHFLNCTKILCEALKELLTDSNLIFDNDGTIEGVTDPDLFIFQPQEIIILSNIVEESFYAQSRPNILRIIPISFQEEINVYNYVQFQTPDKIPITFDRIDDIKIDIRTIFGNYKLFWYSISRSKKAAQLFSIYNHKLSTVLKHK